MIRDSGLLFGATLYIKTRVHTRLMTPAAAKHVSTVMTARYIGLWFSCCVNFYWKSSAACQVSINTAQSRHSITCLSPNGVRSESSSGHVDWLRTAPASSSLWLENRAAILSGKGLKRLQTRLNKYTMSQWHITDSGDGNPTVAAVTSNLPIK